LYILLFQLDSDLDCVIAYGAFITLFQLDSDLDCVIAYGAFIILFQLDSDLDCVIAYGAFILLFQLDSDLDCVIAYGAFGGRVDHMFANMHTLYTAHTLAPTIPLYLMDAVNMSCLLHQVWDAESYLTQYWF